MVIPIDMSPPDHPEGNALVDRAGQLAPGTKMKATALQDSGGAARATARAGLPPPDGHNRPGGRGATERISARR